MGKIVSVSSLRFMTTLTGRRTGGGKKERKGERENMFNTKERENNGTRRAHRYLESRG